MNIAMRLSGPHSDAQNPHEFAACPKCHEHLIQMCAQARLSEHKRIARELHDELGQQLTALLQGLGVLRIQLGHEHAQLLEQLSRLSALTHGAIDTVRNIGYSGVQRCANDPNHDLAALIEDFRQLCPIDLRYQFPPQGIDLDPERASHLYRLVQESLTNILRHANATRARVSLERREHDYVLEISDDGQGFALSDIMPASSGLSGMRERGQQLGGPVIVFSHPGQGTLVQSIFPARPDKLRKTHDQPDDRR